MKPAVLLERLFAGLTTNVAFGDAQKLLTALRFEELRVRGSHHVYARPDVPKQLSVQSRQGQAKPYQLRQLAAIAREYDLQVEEDK